MKKESGFDVFFESLITGNTDKAIRNQEARGQQDFVGSEVLPKKFNSGKREELEKFGVKFGSDVDELFCHASLPNGWKKIPTEHPMWSELIDGNGRKRASIFYKAAFYDRDAFINVSRRYSYSLYFSSDKDGNIVEGDSEYLATCIMDSENPIQLIGVRIRKDGWKTSDQDSAKAVDWLNKLYPNWEDNTAYWDK